MIREITHILSEIPTVSLLDLEQVEFESRIDTKYVFHQDLLVSFLDDIKDELQVLEISGERIFGYENVYFDDPNYTFFKKHHSGFANRSKVRIRKYSDKGPFFFEIKSKTNKGKTEKYRVPLQYFGLDNDVEISNYLRSRIGYKMNELNRKTNINYQRITFTNKDLSEKYTIDFHMNTSNKNGSYDFKNLTIVEVKQKKFSGLSPFLRALRKINVAPTRFSKYCTSVIRLDHSVKHNRFKPILRKVDKIISA
ncbi:polyphosphate polymerase domain-containing protein [bacterium SCSIO 12643]|nr:polyphosphate polymerase domain-containing protein [bacterium SCSIO 12643]